jgi:hypothetical protein
LTDDAHCVRRCDHHIELHEATFDFLGEVLETYNISTRSFRGLCICALRKHGDPNGLSSAARQHDRAAYQLIGFLGVNSQIDSHIDRFIKFGGCRFFH